MALSAHLPCCPDSYYKLKRPGFLRQIELARRRGGVLRAEEVKWFRQIIVDSLLEEAFLQASKGLHFRSQPELPKEKNYERYRVEWFLCLLASIRPEGKINPKMPSRHGQSVWGFARQSDWWIRQPKLEARAPIRTFFRPADIRQSCRSLYARVRVRKVLLNLLPSKAPDSRPVKESE